MVCADQPRQPELDFGIKVMLAIRNYSLLFGLALFFLTFPANSQAASADSTRALQRLTNDLALQLELTYRHDRTQLLERHTEMAAALRAWNASQRTNADYELMEWWLRTAIRRSMPGDGKPLPAPPRFSSRQLVIADTPKPNPQPKPTPTPESAPPKTVVVTPESKTPTTVIPAPEPEQPTTAPAPHVAAKPVPPTPRKSNAKPGQRDFWSRHPASRPLDLSNPFRDDPLPGGVATIETPTVRTAMKLPVIEVTDVAVNLPELSSRIGGYNRALRRIEAAIIAADRPEARELAELLAELDELATQRDFIDLYIVGLSEQERAATPQLDSADAALELVSEKVVDCLSSPAATKNSTERDILQALVRKVSELQRGLPDSPE